MNIPIRVTYNIRERKVWDIHATAVFGDGYWSQGWVSKPATCDSLQQAKDVVKALVASADITTTVVVNVDGEE